METIELSMTFRNSGSSAMELYLEPNADFYLIEPKQEVVIHAICLSTVRSKAMHVEWYPDGCQIYEPGLGSECLDFYVTHEGQRLPARNRGA